MEIEGVFQYKYQDLKTRLRGTGYRQQEAKLSQTRSCGRKNAESVYTDAIMHEVGWRHRRQGLE